MSQALYRKYRSKKLSEIVGQEHITRTLNEAIKSGRISHAYLFTGPRGVGKTSIARILAHEVNGLPYSDESIHLDIIEIDAASNRRIDEIRDLRDKVHIAPTSAKYKVYIIDEVHMLTKEAFNALLKTLEEPPAHVIFILATTEAHKLPETIVSRTQRFTFKPIAADDAAKHLRTIATEEGVTIDDEALNLLAEHGGGSFRDSISLLDQVAGSGKKSIGKKDVEQLLGIAPATAIRKLLKATLEQTPADIVTQLIGLREQGINPVQTARQLAELVRRELLEHQLHLPAADALTLLERLIDIPAAPNPEAALELALLSTNLSNVEATVPAAKTEAKPAEKTRSVTVSETVVPVAAVVEEKPAKTTKADEVKPASKPAEAKTPDPVDEQALAELQGWWPQVLQSVKKHNNTLYGILRMAEPTLAGDELTLTFAFPFHQKRINESRNRDTISSCIMSITGRTLTLTCVVDAHKRSEHSVQVDTVSFVPPEAAAEAAVEAPVSATATEPGDTSLEAITSIFGGGEVLES